MTGITKTIVDKGIFRNIEISKEKGEFGRFVFKISVPHLSKATNYKPDFNNISKNPPTTEEIFSILFWAYHTYCLNCKKENRNETKQFKRMLGGFNIHINNRYTTEEHHEFLKMISPQIRNYLENIFWKENNNVQRTLESIK